MTAIDTRTGPEPHQSFDIEVIGPERYLATHVHVAERIQTEWLDGPKAVG